MTRKFYPGEILFHRKDGTPVFVIAGGSDDVPPVSTPGAPSLVPTPPPTPDQRYFTTEDVERFRAQEREKLYPKLTKQEQLLEELQTKVASFEAEREAFRKAEEERLKAEEEARKRAEEAELSARELLERQRAEMEERFARIEQEREAERAALEKDRQYAALQAYIQRRVREEAEAQTIAPELLDLVDGSSEEQVEASIARLREKTSAIVTNLQAAAAQAGTPAPPRGVSPAGYAATGPMDMHTEQQTITPEEIGRMSMDEWREYRKHFGFAAPNQGQGLFR